MRVEFGKWKERAGKEWVKQNKQMMRVKDARIYQYEVVDSFHVAAVGDKIVNYNNI